MTSAPPARGQSTEWDDIPLETRTLQFPDDRARPISLKPEHWQLYDRLRAEGYPESEMHGGTFTTAVHSACENPVLIDDLLPYCMIAYMDNLARMTWQPEAAATAN